MRSGKRLDIRKCERLGIGFTERRLSLKSEKFLDLVQIRVVLRKRTTTGNV